MCRVFTHIVIFFCWYFVELHLLSKYTINGLVSTHTHDVILRILYINMLFSFHSMSLNHINITLKMAICGALLLNRLNDFKLLNYLMYLKYLLVFKGIVDEKGKKKKRQHLRIIMMECVMRMLSNAVEKKNWRRFKRKKRSRFVLYHRHSPWQQAFCEYNNNAFFFLLHLLLSFSKGQTEWTSQRISMMKSNIQKKKNKISKKRQQLITSVYSNNETGSIFLLWCHRP